MADDIVARGGEGPESKFTPHPEGQYSLRCVDVINLGEKVTQWGEDPARISPKVVLVFYSSETEADGRKREISSREFTISMNEKANLRHFLEAWRGRPYTDSEVLAGVPLGKLEGQTALASIAHKKSQKGRTYAVIQSLMPLPKAMPAPLPSDYQRAPYWEERKKEYAKQVQDFKATVSTPPMEHNFEDFDQVPPEDDGPDSLPF